MEIKQQPRLSRQPQGVAKNNPAHPQQTMANVVQFEGKALKTALLGLAAMGIAGCNLFPPKQPATPPTTVTTPTQTEADNSAKYMALAEKAPPYTTTVVGKAVQKGDQWVLTAEWANAVETAGKEWEIKAPEDSLEQAIYQKLSQAKAGNDHLTIVMYGNPGQTVLMVHDVNHFEVLK